MSKIIVGLEDWAKALEPFEAILRPSVENGDNHFYSNDGRVIEAHKPVGDLNFYTTREAVNTKINA